MSQEDNNKIAEELAHAALSKLTSNDKTIQKMADKLGRVVDHLESIQHLNVEMADSLETLKKPSKIQLKADQTDRLLEELLAETKKKDEESYTLSPELKAELKGEPGQSIVGRPGRDGKDGIGKDGKDGRDGTDGSPDTPYDIRDKLESLYGEYRLDAKAVKNLDKYVGMIYGDSFKRNAFSSLRISSLTEGSVLFAGASGLISQDNTNFFWDDTNNELTIGGNSPRSFASGALTIRPGLLINTSSNFSGIGFGTDYFGTNTNSSAWASFKARGSAAAPLIVASGDALLGIAAFGYDGSTYGEAAEIAIEVDGTPGLVDMPGRIVFRVSPDGSTAVTEAMRISNDGTVLIASNTAVRFDCRAAAVFNENGNDADFRIEGDTRINLFFVDASTDRVGINTASPQGKVDITGHVGNSDILLYWGGESSSTTPIDANFTSKPSATSQVFRLFSLFDPQVANLALYGINNSAGVGGTSATNISQIASKFVQGRFLNSYSGTVATWYGLLIADTVNSGTGTPTLTTQIGIEISQQTFGGTRIALRTQGGGDVIFNEAGTTSNVRMEGDTNANMFYLDGTNDRIGFGTNAPNAFFDCRGAVIINEAAADADVRIEGQTNANLFFTDASADGVGIGTNLPAVLFHVSGGSARFENGGEYMTITPNTPANYVKLSTSATSHFEIESGGHIDFDIASQADYWSFMAGGVEQFRITGTGGLTFVDGQDIAVGSTSGTKIATATTQKLGFFNKAPVVQQTTTSQTPATFVANTSGILNDTATWDGYTIGDIVAILRVFGLIA